MKEPDKKEDFWVKISLWTGIIASVIGIYVFVTGKADIASVIGPFLAPTATLIPTPLIPITPLPPQFPGRIIFDSKTGVPLFSTFVVSSGEAIKTTKINIGTHYSASSDGKRIAFAEVNPSDFEVLVVSDLDGSNRVVLKEGINTFLSGSPFAVTRPFDISPNGNLVVLRVAEDSLSVIDIATKKETSLTIPSHVRIVQFTISPDSQSIAFTTDDHKLYTENLDGTDIHVVANSVRDNEFPSWSSDSKSIAFVYKDAESNDNIDIVDDSGQHTILQGMEYVNGPVWSPDGRYLAFTAQKQEDKSIMLHLWMMNIDGSNLIDLAVASLSKDAFNNDRVIWSPDGNWIAFTLVKSAEDNDLYIINTYTKYKVFIAADAPLYDPQWIH